MSQAQNATFASLPKAEWDATQTAAAHNVRKRGCKAATIHIRRRRLFGSPQHCSDASLSMCFRMCVKTRAFIDVSDGGGDEEKEIETAGKIRRASFLRL